MYRDDVSKEWGSPSEGSAGVPEGVPDVPEGVSWGIMEVFPDVDSCFRREMFSVRVVVGSSLIVMVACLEEWSI